MSSADWFYLINVCRIIVNMNKNKFPTRSEAAIARWLTEGFQDKSKVKSHLAEICDVTRQAVGDWCKFGKVDKRHFSNISKYLESNVPIEAFEDQFNEDKFDKFLARGSFGSGKTSMASSITNKLRKKIIIDSRLQSISPTESAAYIGHIDAWDSDTELEEDEAEIPFFMDVELAAGIGSEITQENYGPKLRFSKSTLRSCGVDPNNAACVKVFGNSMEPRLYDGDVVGVNLGDKRIVDDKVYAINHGSLLRIKKLNLLPYGALRISSFNNEEHADEIISSENRGNVNIIGRIFWSSSIWR